MAMKSCCKNYKITDLNLFVGIKMHTCNNHDSSCNAKIANALYRSKSLKFGNFKLKSGIQSPYYIDLTWLLSSPRDFCCVTDVIAEEVEKILDFVKIDRLASIELKGALLLPSVATKLNLPSVVVRKAPKHYGFTGQVVGGKIVEGEEILFLDDVISDGMSKLEGIKPLEKEGAKIEHILVVVDRELGGKENIEKSGYKFHSLTNTSDLVGYLLQSDLISEKQAKAVQFHTKLIKQ